MAYTEKVSISGTALSFLMYECLNSTSGQEGFLIGNITSEITNHISDSQSDSARLDTQIVVKAVLPLPSASLFYTPIGNIKEDALLELISSSASDVVGWYKYRANNSIKPTFRDRLISKGLQKFFEKYHNRKTFVTCNLTNKVTAGGSTHTISYRFGKINCFDLYEYIEDVTANLGEKVTGYKKAYKTCPQGAFHKILQETNAVSTNSGDAILHIQDAVNQRLAQEAKIAASTENTIRELEAEIVQMTTILSDKQANELQSVYDKMLVEQVKKSELEMAEACAKALREPKNCDIGPATNFLLGPKLKSDSQSSVQVIENDETGRSISPVLMPSKKPFNYAAALKKSNAAVASTSKQNNVTYSEDLISFDDSKVTKKPVIVNEDVTFVGESSPEP